MKLKKRPQRALFLIDVTFPPAVGALLRLSIKACFDTRFKASP